MVSDRIPEADIVNVLPRTPSYIGASGTALLYYVFWLAVGISAITAAHAVLSARGVVYDGSFYLLGIAATRSFHFVEPARLSVQALQQLPAALGARFGVEDLWTLAKLFSLGMSGWPVALTGMCWFVLPRAEKSWIAGPLINLVFAIPTANFIGISEGIIASCLLWLALFLVMFRLARPLGATAAIIAAGACAVANEAAVLCLLFIGWSAAAQYPALRRFPRIAAALVTIISLAGAIYMARWILFPRSTIERTDFLVSILGGFLGSPRTPNLPVIASLVAAVSIGTAILWRSKAWGAVIVGGIAILVCGTISAALPDALVSPGRFFAARGLPVVLTTFLGGLFLTLQRYRTTPERFVTRPALCVVMVLVISQASMQEAATNLWRNYTRDLRALVATGRGDITHDRALTALNGSRSRFRREMLQTWSVQPLSILLAPGGRVTALVEPAETEGWVPYHLKDPRKLPRLPQLDWSKFPQPVS